MTGIRTWVDPESRVRRCDKTERTDMPSAATAIISQIGSMMLGKNAYCLPSANDQQLVEIRFMKGHS